MSILVVGSLAYDYIMGFPDRFKNHILPDHLHILNVSFAVDRLEKEFGGCSGNIAYTMKLLGGDPIMLGVLGKDSGEYFRHFEENSLNTKFVLKSEKSFSASAYITTDKDDNQITAFYPGPGDEALTLLDSDFSDVELALISPTNKEVMIEFARKLNRNGIPLVFDPGQQLTAFSSEELSEMIGLSRFLIGNDYEITMIKEKMRVSEDEILGMIDVLIKTLGKEGVTVRTNSPDLNVPSIEVQNAADPTGAGDSFRAGFFTSYLKGDDLETCAQKANTAASFAVECRGTQNHSFSEDEFLRRFSDAYVK